MADDTVQQVTGSAISSAINPHPSLVQRRAGGRRRDKEHAGKRKDGHALKNRRDEGMESDKVTLTGRQHDADKDTLKPASSSDKSTGKTIDIRI